VDRADPPAGELHQRREITLDAERLDLEAADIAHGSRRFI